MSNNLPKFTSEQLSKAAEKAVEARRARAALKAELAGGAISVTDALDDPRAGKIRVDQFLRAVPGVGGRHMQEAHGRNRHLRDAPRGRARCQSACRDRRASRQGFPPMSSKAFDSQGLVKFDNIDLVVMNFFKSHIEDVDDDTDAT